MILRAFPFAMFAAAAIVSGQALAQQYRWIDEKGRVQFGDVAPPGARQVRKTTPAAAKAEQSGAMPFEIADLQKKFPVTLYTAPNCKAPCEQARGALNKRGIPFSEVQVWNAETLDQLKKVAGSDAVPVMVVGRSVQSGFEQGRYDALLDSAGYPAAGVYPARAQAAPALPEGFEPPPVAEPAATAGSDQKAGPYDTSGLTGPAPKPGQYDPSGLVGPPPKPGQYGVPGASK